MGQQFLASSLMPPRSRSAAAVPVSMGFHLAAVAALLAAPLVGRGDPPPLRVRPPDPLVAPIVIAVPAVTLPPSQPIAARPGPRLTRRTPDRPAAATPPSIPVPLAPDPPALSEVVDEGGTCVGCALTTGGGSAVGGEPGGGDGSGTADGSGNAPLIAGVHVSPPAKLRHVEPVYPELAIRARVQGTVVIECVVDVDGRVSRMRVVRSIPLLDRAAEAAVQQWRYRPTLLRGVAVPVLMTVTVHFHLK